MKTAKRTGKPADKDGTEKQVETRQAVEGTAKTITVGKTAQKFTGARAQWYAALLAHDGQTDDAFIVACTKQPPAKLKTGKAEDPRGWLRFFVRTGVASLT
jgi:hypothetical protein